MQQTTLSKPKDSNLIDEIPVSHFDYPQAMTAGHKYNYLVAERLKTNGIKCHVPDLVIAQTLTELRSMTLNEKDIVLETVQGNIEVKSMNRYFGSDPNTFLFPKVIVDTVSGFEQKLETPVAYVIVSQITKEMFVVPVTTKPHWEVFEAMDYDRGFVETFYRCKRELCKPFEELVDYLKSLTS
jgi:hypothetical protein